MLNPPRTTDYKMIAYEATTILSEDDGIKELHDILHIFLIYDPNRGGYKILHFPNKTLRHFVQV